MEVCEPIMTLRDNGIRFSESKSFNISALNDLNCSFEDIDTHINNYNNFKSQQEIDTPTKGLQLSKIIDSVIETDSSDPELFPSHGS